MLRILTETNMNQTKYKENKKKIMGSKEDKNEGK